MDKITLGSSAILGLRKDTNLTANECVKNCQQSPCSLTLLPDTIGGSASDVDALGKTSTE